MIKFGTGGWREIIGDGFTKANVQLLSQALANIIKTRHKDNQEVCIGYDRRFLSKEAAHWAAETLAANKIRCHVIDRAAPTPLVMFAVDELNTPFGMGVTASHNPAIYNGVKLFTTGGRDAQEEVTNRIEEEIAKVKGAPLSADYAEGQVCGLINEINPLNDYIDRILELVDVRAIKDACLKIALDPMYGVSQTSLRTILLTSRCDVLVIHERHDTLFGGRLPAPNSRTLSALSDFVTENHCNFGIATDGDADRLGVIDDNGVFLHPNRLLVLLYYYLMEYRGWRGPVVRNISTTHLLDKVAQAYGEACYEVPVGFKHISAKMEETNAIIGGESSGGLTVRGHIHGKDGIYAAALLTEMVAITKKSLSALYGDILERFGEICSADAEIRINQKDRDAISRLLFVDKVLPHFEGDFIPERISYVDGCKVCFKNGGWVSARFSGTEPLLRISGEMPVQELADRAVGMFGELIAHINEERQFLGC